MVALGKDAGLTTVALLTDMSTPLGLTAGNALEVRESVEVLGGGGPADVVELTVALAREMLAAAGVEDVDPADKLADGSAMDTWKAMIRAQGGDPDATLPTARETHVVTAPASGVLSRLDALAVGMAAWRLGAGRARKEDPVQAGAGVEMHAKPGDRVTEGQPLLTLHTDEPERFDGAFVTANLFATLGVQPQLGRNFVDEETAFNGRPATLLTDRYWRSRFTADPGIVGKSLSMNGQSATIGGVLPGSFDFASVFRPGMSFDVLTPFAVSPETHSWGNTLEVVGRLKPGIGIAAAQDELARLRWCQLSPLPKDLRGPY